MYRGWNFLVDYLSARLNLHLAKKLCVFFRKGDLRSSIFFIIFCKMNRLTTAASLILCLTVLCCSLLFYALPSWNKGYLLYLYAIFMVLLCYYCCLFLDKEGDTSKVHKFKNLSHSNYTELYPFFGAVVVVCFTATATSHPCLHTIFASI